MQPFYNVMLSNGSTRYMPQEQITIEWKTKAEIENLFSSQIGRYFTHYNGRNYELNEQMKMMYPDDQQAVDEIYRIYGKAT